MHYLETHSVDPCYNLAFEEYILKNRGEGDWLLLWQNANTVVVGRNQNAAEEINRDFVREHGISVVRRETGGGAVYHDLGNLNYSFITDLGTPGELSIGRFTAPVCRALESMGVHAQTTGRNDVTVDGRKVSGVAQRVYGGRVLHHGTLLFDSDPAMVSGALNADPDKFASKSSKSVRSRIGNIRQFLPRDMTLSEFWARLLAELAQGGIEREEPSEGELAEIRALADEKYRGYDWTYGRSPRFNYSSRRRFPGGTLSARLEVKDGVIASAGFFGDFMATLPNAPAEDALRGVRFTQEAVRAALEPLELAPMFGGITLDDILGVLFAD
ncbi:MAG: lipoate--protein ligase [Oscillospiraceae bacterium]|nr:lipoate--protein ligase [Oscillospiraceae bacterium]